jgi:hypothetical protein
MVTNDKHVKTWMVKVVTYLKESGGQLPKIDLFVSSLTKLFQLHNLHTQVQPNCSMSANKTLGMTRRYVPGVHPQRLRTTRNKLLIFRMRDPVERTGGQNNRPSIIAIFGQYLILLCNICYVFRLLHKSHHRTQISNV